VKDGSAPCSHLGCAAVPVLMNVLEYGRAEREGP
jgi:hypothetical protein